MELSFLYNSNERYSRWKITLNRLLVTFTNQKKRLTTSVKPTSGRLLQQAQLNSDYSVFSQFFATLLYFNGFVNPPSLSFTLPSLCSAIQNKYLTVRLRDQQPKVTSHSPRLPPPTAS